MRRKESDLIAAVLSGIATRIYSKQHAAFCVVPIKLFIHAFR